MADTNTEPLLVVGMVRVAMPQRLSPCRLMKARLPLMVAWFEAGVKNMPRPSAVSLVRTIQAEAASVDRTQLEPVAQNAPPLLLVKLSVFSVTLVYENVSTITPAW